MILICDLCNLSKADAKSTRNESIKMTLWHADVARMAKHMNMVRGPLWWGDWSRSPPKSGAGAHHTTLPPSLRPSLHDQ